MDTATEKAPAGALSAFLAGLQAGMLGACSMLVWLGISSFWQRRSFWTAANLMASLFYGPRAIRSGFSGLTLSGLAVYLILYSLLGAVFALAVRNRFSLVRTALVSALFAMFWYYLSFRLLWKSALPLVALLHAERPTALGHLLYGAVLGRFPKYVPGSALPADAAAPSIPEPERQ